MKGLSLLICLLISHCCSSQNWIDTSYAIATAFNVGYGSATDFKGADYILKMDISVPVGDSPPECGRPLMVVVHGGAWYGGDKGEGYAARMREDFAKRGYATASVNYRQGLFNTEQKIDCPWVAGWKCWNMTDTSEWYRANYRAIQDIHGAIRYLVNEKEIYNINPDNIFLAGESAGGFIVLGVGFIDDETEVLEPLVSEYPDAPAPHPSFEEDCIQAFGIANSIAEMDLSRPDLGPVKGETNLPVQSNYRIRGVGNFFGGAFNNIFETKSSNSPALYMFHQPCDLLVPIGHNKLLAGFSACAADFPTYCQHILNRPFVYGSHAIASLIDKMELNGIPTCEYMFDNTGKNYTCFEQVANPDIVCHAIDNYWLRTTNMATFFSDKIAACSMSYTSDFATAEKTVALHPNPAEDEVTLIFKQKNNAVRIKILDAYGRTFLDQSITSPTDYSINLMGLNSGCYYIVIEMDEGVSVYPLLKI